MSERWKLMVEELKRLVEKYREKKEPEPQPA